jgi:hypothetical protein
MRSGNSSASAWSLVARGYEQLLSRLPTDSHLGPLVRVAATFSADIVLVRHSADPFRIKSTPAIVIIGDDTDKSFGPKGFHDESTRNLLRSAGAVALISATPYSSIYATAGFIAGSLGCQTVIIETRLEHEASWFGLVKQCAPNAPTILSTAVVGSA